METALLGESKKQAGYPNFTSLDATCIAELLVASCKYVLNLGNGLAGVPILFTQATHRAT